MIKVVLAILAVLLTMAFAVPVMAAGEPTGNFKKGMVKSVDKSAGTIEFVEAKSGETMTLTLAEGVNLDKVSIDKKVMVSLKEKEGHEVVVSVTDMFITLVSKSFLFILFVGFVGGLVSGFIGSGGAFVLTPGMMSLGVPAAVAVASNMCHKFPKAMVGAYKRFRYGQVDLKLGLVMAVSAIVGVQVGIKIQRYILNTWGEAGSALYVSLSFVFILVTVGGYVFYDAWKSSKTGGEATVSKIARKLQTINLPPMITFKTAGVRMSIWFTVPVGLATGMLAATIAVGGFIGVPGMIYVVGAPALVASATELVIAFVMGFAGSIQWAMHGLIDIRLTLLILAASLFGVQIGALGTTYVKDHMIKVVMGSIMLIVAVSRGLAVPTYLNDLGLITITKSSVALLKNISFITMAAALLTGALIIIGALIKGMRHAKAEERLAESTGNV